MISLKLLDIYGNVSKLNLDYLIKLYEFNVPFVIVLKIVVNNEKSWINVDFVSKFCNFTVFSVISGKKCLKSPI